MNIIQQLTDLIVRVGSLREIPEWEDDVKAYNRLIQNLYADMQRNQLLRGVDGSLDGVYNWLPLNAVLSLKFMPQDIKSSAQKLRTLRPANNRHEVGHWHYDHPLPQIAALVAAWKYWLHYTARAAVGVDGILPEDVRAALTFEFPNNVREQKTKGPKPQHTDLLPRPALVYIAAPYSVYDKDMPDDRKRLIVEMRMETVKAFIQHLLRNGEMPISPLTNHWVIQDAQPPISGTWDFWKQYSQTVIERCDAVYVLKLAGWDDSEGVTAERVMATKANKPIRYWDILSTGFQCNLS